MLRSKAAVLYEAGKMMPYGDSRPIVIEDINLEGPGAAEILVEIHGAGLCHSDLSVINGSRVRPLPLVLGHEAAGVIRETGPGVDRLSVGDHVVFGFLPTCGVCQFCKGGRPSSCIAGQAANAAGTLLSGRKHFSNASGQALHHHQGVSAFSQYTVASETSVVRIDKHFPLDIAALFGCAVMSGVGAVMNTANVRPGEITAVFGMGGVGLCAVMGAVAKEAAMIVAVDLMPQKLELAQKMGATHTVCAADQDPVQAIREITGGGAHWTFEAVGHEAVLAQAFAATCPDGGTVAIGLPHPSKTVAIPACQLVAEERKLYGSYMGSCQLRRDVPRFLEMYDQKRLPVDMLKTNTLELDQINEGFDALHAATVVRQVITSFG